MAEATPVRMRIFDQVREAALNWDGGDPISIIDRRVNDLDDCGTEGSKPRFSSGAARANPLPLVGSSQSHLRSVPYTSPNAVRRRRISIYFGAGLEVQAMDPVVVSPKHAAG